jgi:hypothetical protein
MAIAVRLFDFRDKNHDPLTVEQLVYFKLNWLIQTKAVAGEVSCLW